MGMVNVFPFRCQLCTNRFRAFYAGARHNRQVFDRRQYVRLRSSIDAWVLDRNQLMQPAIVTEISMDGCTVETTGFQKGAFVELRLKPAVAEDTIRIETAMVCSVHSSSLGVKFLEIQPDHQPRLGQVVLGLLVNQSSYLSAHS